MLNDIELWEVFDVDVETAEMEPEYGDFWDESEEDEET